MNGDWLSALPTILIVLALVIFPGLVVRLLGWDARSIGPYLLVPAFSIAVVAVAANIAPFVGMRWSLLPVAVVTVVAGGVAWMLRRGVGAEELDPPPRTAVLAVVVGGVLAATVLALQLTYVFVSPTNISQTFDNIVHLNSIRLALDTGDASAFGIGRTSDIGFYPNAWHSLVTLGASLSGAAVPVAVNATNVVIGAVVWPLSTMALAAAFFRERASALVGSAALATAFGAFPILLMSFGVLYPNATGYAVLPAGLAALWWLLQAKGAPTVTRAAVALVVAVAAITLGHPNAFLALFAMGAPLAMAELLRRALASRARSEWILGISVTAALLAVGAALWRFWRTGHAMSQWGPWTDTGQAIVEGLALSPRSQPITIVAAVLVLAGIIAAVFRPQQLVLLIPFAVALFMFVVVSGTPYSFFRDMITNPWYNDSNRLAALLPIAGIPVATLGIVAITDLAKRLSRRFSVPRPVTATVAALAAVALFALGAGPNAASSATAARGSYLMDDTSALLTSSERDLLERLGETTDDDALILGDPWTGTALAFAIADRDVVERHIFSSRSDDVRFLEYNLEEIGVDPAVCAAINRVGVTHVLDFGTQNVFNQPDANLDRASLDDLTPSQHLVLVDSEGAAARLFRIEGC